MATYTDFITLNIAPYLAQKIGVYDSDGNRVGSIPLDTLKPDYGTRLYRFGLLSDVHNLTDLTTENTADLQRALTYFNEKQSVAMTCVCGDISQNGTASEFAIYKGIVDDKSADTPVYTTTGNHDATTSGLNTSTWKSSVGYDQYFIIDKSTDTGVDHFIFFGQNLWGNPTDALYTTEGLSWLETLLEQYKNERCFIFTHLFFPEGSGNFKEIYPSGNWLGGTCLTRLLALRDKYLNTVWFSGHSHWKWYLQKYEDKANVWCKTDANGNRTSGWCIHVPSCASPIDSDGTSTRVSMPEESEGAIVDVYDTYIDIRGMDMKNGKYLPIAQYRIDTTLKTIEEESSEYLTASSFVDNASKNSGMTATQLDDNYVLLYFNLTSQGFHIQSPSYTTTSTSATLTECEYTCYSDADCTTAKSISTGSNLKAGFYTTDSTYTLDAGSSLLVDVGSGALFNVSSGYTDGFPLYVKLKAKVSFN